MPAPPSAGDAPHSIVRTLKSILGLSPSPGRTFKGVVATFTAPGPNRKGGDFTALIVWGDGSAATAGTVSDQGGGVFAVSGSHRFHHRGRFPVAVLITDARGTQGFSVGTASVHRRGARARLATTTAPHVMHDMALSQMSTFLGRPV